MIVYDPDRVLKVVNFIEMVLRHPKESYKPFKLIAWEFEYIQNVFGYIDDETGLRVVRRCYLEVAKKNGKSELAARPPGRRPRPSRAWHRAAFQMPASGPGSARRRASARRSPMV